MTRFSRSILAIALLFTASGASGAMVYSQTPTIDGGFISDADGSVVSERFYVADDFTLSGNALVTSVVWRGIDVGSPSPDDFTIDFYTDASNPDALLQSFSIGTPSSRTDTGLDDPAFGFDIFEYVADLGSGISLSSGSTHWVSIFNNTVGDTPDDFWAWAGNISVSTGAIAVESDDQSNWSAINGGGPTALSEEQYFQLVSTVVPIPPAIWLFGSSLGLLGWMRRRAV
jgi:hypothetical protein